MHQEERVEALCHYVKMWKRPFIIIKIALVIMKILSAILVVSI